MLNGCIIGDCRDGMRELIAGGSGTTEAVAIRLGRRFIGCEINPHYDEMRKRRARQLGLHV
jgi:hypothetical protein